MSQLPHPSSQLSETSRSTVMYRAHPRTCVVPVHPGRTLPPGHLRGRAALTLTQSTCPVSALRRQETASFFLPSGGTWVGLPPPAQVEQKVRCPLVRDVTTVKHGCFRNQRKFHSKDRKPLSRIYKLGFMS